MSNELSTTGPTEISDLMIDWQALGEGLAENHADWLPFLVFGMPYVQIARIFGCDKSNVTHALKRHPELARAVAQGRKMVKRQLHYVWLDQKAVSAWRSIDEFLLLEPFEVDEYGQYVHDKATRRTLIQEKAKMIRFVIQQLGLQVQRYEVTHNVPTPMFKGDDKLAQLVVERVTMVAEDNDKDVIAGNYKVLKEGKDIEKMSPTEEEQEIEAAYDKWHTNSSAKFGGQDTV